MSAGSTQYFLSDRLSARMTLDSSGTVLGRQAHLPFGEDFAGSGTQEKHHFTQYERDSEAGTDYAVNRQYATSVGRFMRVDPVAPAVTLTQVLNRYSYTGNDPVNAFDPDGRVTVCNVIASGPLFLSMGGDWALIGSFTLSRCEDIGSWRTEREGGGSGAGKTAQTCRSQLAALQRKAAAAFATSVTNSQQIAGNAGQSYLAAFNNGITYYQDPARFPFTGTNEVKGNLCRVVFWQIRCTNWRALRNQGRTRTRTTACTGRT